jgi:hypothetical protein
MTPDPIMGVLEQLAATRDQLSRLDDREAGHYAAITGRLEEITELITNLGRHMQGPSEDADGYSPGPAPAWWRLTDAERDPALTRLRAWVEQIYRPGYGHLAVTLAPCWDTHDLCLYALDILSELWSFLYLQPARTPGTLSAQAEYQARILPALAGQLMTETTRCDHASSRLQAPGQAWGRP